MNAKKELGKKDGFRNYLAALQQVIKLRQTVESLPLARPRRVVGPMLSITPRRSAKQSRSVGQKQTAKPLKSKLILSFSFVLLLICSSIPLAYAEEASDSTATQTAATTANTTANSLDSAPDSGSDSSVNTTTNTDTNTTTETIVQDQTTIQKTVTQTTTEDAKTTQTTTKSSRDSFRDVQSVIAIEDINNLDRIFQATIPVQEGDFQGQISLDPANPYTIEPIYQSQTAEVDRELVVEGLPDNDATRLEKTKSFVVRSDAAPDATQQRVLELAEVSYQVTKLTSLGLPVEYAANLTYRGAEEFLVLTAYRVTAHYFGVITSEVTENSIQPIVKEIEIVQDATPLSEPVAEINYAAIAAAATAVLVLVGLLFWVLILCKNIKLVRTDNNGSTVLLRRRSKLSNGSCSVEIPARINLLDGANYEFLIKQSLAGQEGYLIVSWQGHVVAQELLTKKISLNLQEVLAKDTVIALDEEIVASAVMA